MSSLLALRSIALLGMGVTACGGAGSRTGPSSSPSSDAATGSDVATATSTTPGGGYLRGDDDTDETNHRDEDDRGVRGYGHAASAADRRAVTALVTRYFAAAAAGDGADACSLIYAGLARSSNLGEAAEVAYPPAPSVPPLRGESCAQIASLLFKEDRRHLATDAATIEVTSVRVEGVRGLALLGFRTTPERQIPVRRERGVWKIDALLDEELP